MKTYGTVQFDRAAKTWMIHTTPDVATRAKRIFPRIPQGAQSPLPLADNARNGEELRWFLQRFPHEMDEMDRAHLAARADAVIEQASIVDRILAEGYKPGEFKLLKPLRPYQAIPVEICLRTGAILCADDTGLGKTVEGLGLLSDPRARPGLIVCPTHLPSQWEAKVREFLGDGLLVHLLDKGKPYDLVERCGRIPDIVITNFNKLTGWAGTLAEFVSAVVVDEAHRFRHPDTQRYEAWLHLRDRARFRMFLSATPIINYGDEVHSVLEAMQEDSLGTRSEFLREYCAGSSGSRKAKVDDPAALNAELRRRGLMVRRSRKDVNRELPPVNTIVHVLDVSDGSALAEQESSIAALAEVLMAEGGRGIDKMQAARDLDLKLRQSTGIDKAPFAAKFIRMLCAEGQKVLAFAWHRSVYDILLEALGPGQKDGEDDLPDLRPVLYTGSEKTAKQKDASRDAFVHGDSQVMLVSLRSGEGIDGLQDVCSTTVHVELDFSPQVMKQNVDRVNRDGQRNAVFAYVLLAEEGSDPIIADILGVKAGQFDGIFNASAQAVEETPAIEVSRMKHVAAKYLEQKKVRKAAEEAAPKLAPLPDLRPVVKPAPVVQKPPPPPARPAPDRWITLRGSQIDANVEAMITKAGIGVSLDTLRLLRTGKYKAEVGFAGKQIVAFKLERI